MKKTTKNVIVSMLLCTSLVSVAAGVAVISAPHKANAEVQTLDTFQLKEYGEIRKYSPLGLRFIATIDENIKAQYPETGGWTYGTTLMPTQLIPDGEELTIDTQKSFEIPTTKWANGTEIPTYYSVLAGKDESGNIVDLPESYYNVPISARGYVTNGTETYYTANTVERSVGYIAAVNVATGKDTSELLQTIAAATTVELKQTVAEMSTVESSALLVNKIANESGVATLYVGGVPYTGAQISYTASGSNVSAENGTVKALSAGSASVTASIEFLGKTYTLDCPLTINDEYEFYSDYSILVPAGTLSANYAAPVTYAANDLQKLFKEATGVTLPIVEETGSETTGGKYISLGATSLAAENSVDITSVKDTASALKTVNSTVFLKGNTDEGTMYGAYELLGAWFGYEYYAKDTYSLNKVMAVDLPETTEYDPAIEYSISPSDDIGTNDNLLNKYRMNNWYDDIMVVNGGRIHNTFSILPPFSNMESSETAGNYTTYPEWYTAQYSGTGRTFTDDYGRACPYELCFNARGDSEKYALMVNTAVAQYTAALEADKTLNKASLSIRDNVIWCQCSACCNRSGNVFSGYTYTYKETPTDAALDFLNDVCAGIRTWMTENNDPRLNTFRMIFLAYYTTGAAPTTETTLDPYIDVWFAESFAVYTLPMNDSTAAGETSTAWTNLQAWAALLDQSQNCTNGTRNNNLLVWTYNSNMYQLLAPYDSFNSMRVNYGLFEGLNVNSVYNYTDSAMSAWASLKKYLASQLAWNANPNDTEWDGWIDNFFANAYGAGATEMQAWFEDYLTYAATIANKFNVAHNITTDPITGSIYLDVATSEFFSQTELEEWLGYATAALAALDQNDPNYQTYYNNIALERLSPIYLLLEIYGDSLDEATKIDYVATFCGEAVSLGVTKIGHTKDIDETLAKYNALLVAESSVAVGVGETVEATDIFDNEAIASIMVNGTNVYNEDGSLSLASTATGVYKAIVTGENGTKKIVELHYADKVIRTVADLAAVKYTGTNITGYYVLDGDIDAAGATISGASYGWSQNNGFQGVFNGRGYTISNIAVGSYGIFGTLGGATVQNVNFTGINLTAHSSLLAWTMYKTTVENVNVTYAAIDTTTPDWRGAGLLVARQTGTQSVWTNVTLDATGLEIPIALGLELNDLTGSDVEIKAASVSVIGYSDNGTTAITEWPTFITFTKTVKTVEETISTEVLTEVSGATFTHSSFTAGETVTMTVNGNAVTATAYDGYVTVGDLSGVGMTVGNGGYTAVITTSDYILTYANVFYATQIINDLSELSVVQATSTSDEIYGYYVLGNDIDGNGATLANTVQIWNQNQGFRGTLDGRGHTISNFNTGNYGIFGNLAYGAVMKNVTLNVNKSNSNVIAYAVRAAKITDVTVNVGAIQSATWYALADEMNNSTVTNLTVVYAEGVLVSEKSRVLCKSYTSTTFTNVAITTNIQNAEMITNSGTPDGVTVTTIGKLPTVEETISTEVLTEVSGATFTHSSFTAGETVTMTVNGNAVTATAYDGYVTVGDLSGVGMTVGNGGYTAVITTSDYILTYANVFYATQIINDLSELSVVQATSTSDEIYGYYVLGNDIDGNGATLASTVQIWNQNYGFRGTLDGRGRTISNFNTGNYGIFGNLAYGGVIKNVTLNVNKSNSNVIAYAVRAAKITDVKINIASINSATWYELASEINNSTVTNLTVVYADSVIFDTVHALCKTYSGTTFTNVAITTNIQNAEKITSTGTPDGVTVTTTGEAPVVQVEETIETKLAADASTGLIVSNANIKSGDSVTVTVNGNTMNATASADGTITVDVSGASLTAGTTYSIVLETAAYKLTCTDVIFADKVIRTVADLAAVKYTGTNITGYFAVAGNIAATTWVDGSINEEHQISGGEVAWSQNSGFQGTFDGRGYTISGLAILGRGIFGSLGKATIKNVSFTGVQLGWDGAGYVLAQNIYNTAITDVYIQVTGVYKGRGSATWAGVMCNNMQVYTRLTNVTIDVTTANLVWALAYNAELSSTANVYTNVTVYTNDATKVIGDSGNATQSETLPDGITVNPA